MNTNTRYRLEATFFSLLLIMAALPFLLFVPGCAQLGLATPQTFEERLAVGYSTVTAVRNTAATLVNTRKISAEDGSNVLQQTDNARAGLDIARKIGSAGGGDSKITQVLTGLDAVSAYLKAKEK